MKNAIPKIMKISLIQNQIWSLKSRDHSFESVKNNADPKRDDFKVNANGDTYSMFDVNGIQMIRPTVIRIRPQTGKTW